MNCLHNFRESFLFISSFCLTFTSFKSVKHVVCGDEHLSDSFVGYVGYKGCLAIPFATGDYDVFHFLYL